MNNPIIVVRAILEDLEKKILILKRDSGTGRNLWCLPGGKVEDQTIEQTVIDEILEETGLIARNPIFLFYQNTLPEKGKKRFIHLYFSATYFGQIKLNEESSDYIWVKPEDLDKYDFAFSNDQGIIRYLHMSNHNL